MIRGKLLIAGLIAAFAFTAGAQAADMPRNYPPPPEYKDYQPRYQELLSGWYLRGDVGYRWNSMGSVESTTPITESKFTNGPDVSLGWGYKYQWFRADATIDRGFVARFTGNTAAAVSQPQYTARITTLSALANAYIDFGTWSGFTPYVGAGVGATQLRAVGYADTAFPNGGYGTPAVNRVNFSWAWMAGVSYRVSPTWLIDIGYRHLDLGRIDSTTGSNSPLDRTTFNNLSADEIRIGVRYLFD